MTSNLQHERILSFLSQLQLKLTSNTERYEKMYFDIKQKLLQLALSFEDQVIQTNIVFQVRDELLKCQLQTSNQEEKSNPELPDPLKDINLDFEDKMHLLELCTNMLKSSIAAEDRNPAFIFGRKTIPKINDLVQRYIPLDVTQKHLLAFVSELKNLLM